MRLWPIGSVDITQIDNEFHSVRYVDFETGELKHALISFEEKRDVGSVGQLECLWKPIISLYPASVHVNVENILQFIQAQAHRDAPVSDDENETSIHSENNEMADDDSIFKWHTSIWIQCKIFEHIISEIGQVSFAWIKFGQVLQKLFRHWSHQQTFRAWHIETVQKMITNAHTF